MFYFLSVINQIVSQLRPVKAIAIVAPGGVPHIFIVLESFYHFFGSQGLDMS